MTNFYSIKVKTLACLFGLLCLATTTHAKQILKENFEYSVGNLYQKGGWVRYGNQTASPIQIISSNLTYNGYQATAIGGSAKANCGTNFQGNEDLQIKLPDSISEGTVYMSALVNIQKVNGDQFFLCLGGRTKNSAITDGASTANYARLFVVPGTTDSKFKFGLGKNTTKAAVTTEPEYDIDTTYLVILKH